MNWFQNLKEANQDRWISTIIQAAISQIESGKDPKEVVASLQDGIRSLSDCFKKMSTIDQMPPEAMAIKIIRFNIKVLEAALASVKEYIVSLTRGY